MSDFSYYSEFYHLEIFDIDEMLKDEVKEQIKYAYDLEKYFNRKNYNVDLIRTAIINSYRSRHILKYDERLYHVRGVMYSMQCMNFKDLDKFSKYLDNTNNPSIEKTLFELRDFSDSYDSEFFGNYLDNITSKCEEKEEDITDSYLEGKINSVGEVIVKDKNEDCMTVEEFFNDSFEIKKLDPLKKLDLFKKNFSVYKKGILDKKTEIGTLEYEYVSLGMDDFYGFIIEAFDLISKVYEDENKKRSRNLLLTI